MGHRERVSPYFKIKIPLIAVADHIFDGWSERPPVRAGESFLAPPVRAAELVVFGSAKIDTDRVNEEDLDALEFCIDRLPVEMIVRAWAAGLRPNR
jgi:hypothetical protein